MALLACLIGSTAIQAVLYFIIPGYPITAYSLFWFFLGASFFEGARVSFTQHLSRRPRHDRKATQSE